MKTSSLFSMGILLLCLMLTSCIKEPPVLVPSIDTQEFASGLKAPIGMDMDHKKWLWVAEAGTGNDDSQLSVFLPNGNKFVAIQNFPSEFRAAEGISVGLNHVLIQGNTIWMLHDKGFLFKADINGFAPGRATIDWSHLQKEDIATFVVDYDFEDDTNMSNPYNMAFGPNGHLYITDAGANAIIKRDPSGHLSVFATLPRTQNPLPVGPPFVEAVPTGIVFDGQKFLVTGLLGFPFPEGRAKIFAIDLNGVVSEYKDGLSSLTDIEKVSADKYVITEFARFALGAGWTSNTGRLLQINQGQETTLLDLIDTPTSVVSAGSGVYFVNSFKQGKVTMVVTKGY
ncbi:ScyD/ScyE family protein [Pararhodonellum marinum]|uniref:ScyD/ScyE family protein n=1 Tax=Pararhodonellum marinum TaxID=2755358 RepID=UPI00188E4529|nr:ScyD/ScyE family protein [Pararhodonellum marinum]